MTTATDTIEVTTDSSPTPIPIKSFEEAFQEHLQSPGQIISMEALPITMFKDYVEVEITAGVKKLLTYEDFKLLIDKALNDVKVESSIKGMLPPSNMIFFNQTATSIQLNCYYTGTTREMLYGSTKMNIVTPNIILSITLRRENSDWLVNDTRYLCTDLPVNKLPKTFIQEVQPSKGIYLMPMSNTYDDGRMCFGGNSMPVRFKDENLRGLDWYFRYLWETPFNSDLGIRAIGSSMGVTDWYRHLAAIAKEGKPFPYTSLNRYKPIL